MHTVRMTLNVDEELLKDAQEAVPGATKTELVHQGLRALLARQAAERLAAMGGKAPRVQRAKRSAWSKK
jgi:Arc/MetJ family transcription regulator